jgi:hypothetical protein
MKMLFFSRVSKDVGEIPDRDPEVRLGLPAPAVVALQILLAEHLDGEPEAQWRFILWSAWRHFYLIPQFGDSF